MPLILPNAPQFSRYESNLPATPSAITTGTAVTHNGVAHTKNATWTELIAATAFDCELILVTVYANNVANGNSSTLLDIGIGAAAAETAIIPDIAAGFVNTVDVGGGGRTSPFPLYIPSGSRLSARTQSVRTTGSVTVLVQLFGGNRHPDAWWYGSHVTTYGANAANSAGAKFTPGNSGAEGTGVSVGTTTAAHKVLVPSFQGHPDDVGWAVQVYHLDVGIDSASTDWFEADRYMLDASAAEALGTPIPMWPIYRPVPSGTELMVRGESSSATADALSAVIHGIS
jgi:hypothetical protein